MGIADPANDDAPAADVRDPDDVRAPQMFPDIDVAAWPLANAELPTDTGFPGRTAGSIAAADNGSHNTCANKFARGVFVAS